MGHAQKTSSAIRRLGSLSLIAAFLVLGFCPLRNVLCKLAQPEPVRKAQPAPDYAKITSGKECEIGLSRTAASAHPSWALTAAFTLSFAAQLSGWRRLVLSASGASHTQSLPIYLLNCVLLI